ncbi:MAG TPA: hypothetical protein VFH80_19295 [Solirubrobacteraceae bacterium]|nr:hypothetical protein [Solirubrobacteraceae bacterium]
MTVRGIATILGTVWARPWIVALVVVAACGSSVAESAGSTAAATRCGPASARTLVGDGRVRVYVLHQVVYGCSVARGRSFRLGHASRALAESRVGPVAVAGDVAGYGLQSFGVDTVTATIVVRRLTDGTEVKELRATRAVGAEAFQSIGSVAVLASGAVAWIGSEHSIVGHRSAIEVHAAGAGGDRVLDSGANVDPASLRLHGSRLSWVDGGATRHATLH